ncbi:bifunctional phosphopantothenoylcysteine decarboxylase/phosphopantothenate--cysteine ligase CoaBC [Marinicrinis sediminis]|uniref:Coenzyme A biosynthesis bifunctional protein CoaBC n=1 Tax=Marinicrinis sediminis TaxID=1652465 RepID=A0ABW5R5F1_9BACL
MLKGKTIVIGVCGGIASYKAVGLCSMLVKAGAKVQVMMTQSAAKFVTPFTFQTISRHQVYTDTFEEQDAARISHIDVADHADLIVIAPATANMIGKMAHGLADDMMSTTLLATTAPIWVSPAMNVHMLAHAAVQHNLEILRQRGVRILDPAEGQLACGYTGKGRLPEPEDLFQEIQCYFQAEHSWQGKRLLVTAGGTRERIDPVRYIGNDSSGKMGYALAEAAARKGADVVLVSANVAIPAPEGVRLVQVETAEQMRSAVLQEFDQSHVVIKAAAVADYRPIRTETKKRKKQPLEPGASQQTDADNWTIELVPNPDILAELGERRTHQFIIGFAAETHDLAHYAMDKLRRKKCQLMVANDISAEGAGFHGDTNIVSLFDDNGLLMAFPQMTKRELADRILSVAEQKLPGSSSEVQGGERDALR